MSERSAEQEVVPIEDLVAEVDDLLRLADERAHEARRARYGDPTDQPDISYRAAETTPDITGPLRDRLLASLSAEVIPAMQAEPGGQIAEWELDREVAKKALVGIKISTLRRVAAEMRVDKRGRADQIAERLARAFRYDAEQIARVVLENEEEPTPERGHGERIFPLTEPVDLATCVERLTVLKGRFVRVAVARWFVFGAKPVVAEGTLRFAGTLHTYAAWVTGDPEHPTLGSAPTEQLVEFELTEGSRALRVLRGSAPAVRAAARALAAVGIRLLGRLPTGRGALPGRAATLDPRTALMLDLLYSRLPHAGARKPNLTVARFRLSDEDGADEDERPSLRAVRFEGQHLLDSVTACRLIAREARALVDASLLVSVGEGDGEARFPIRLGFERDHTVVLTGFGRLRSEASAGLHAALVEQVEDAVESGVADPARLETLAERIERRAAEQSDAEQADMFDDEGENDADDLLAPGHEAQSLED